MSDEILQIIESGKVSQERRVSNELFTSESVSESRRKTELDKFKKESLGILSSQLTDRVTETQEANPIAHIVTYSGYFINEDEFNKIKEVLKSWGQIQANSQRATTKKKTKVLKPAKRTKRVS